MNRKRLPVWRTLLVIANDALAVGAGLLLAYWLRFFSPLTHWVHIRNGFDPQHYLAMFPYAWVIWMVALRMENLYRRRSRVFDKMVVRRIVSGSMLAVLVLIAVNYFGGPGQPSYSRTMTVMMLCLVIAALFGGRIVLDQIFRWMVLHRGIGQSRTLIIGTGPLAEYICRTLLKHPERGVLPIGLLNGRPAEASPDSVAGLPVLGTIDQLTEIIAASKIDEVILAQTLVDRDRVPGLLIQCERALVEFSIVPEATELLLSGMTVETIDGLAMLGTRETPLQGWNAALKRMIDFMLALVGLIVMAPLIGLLAWLVKRQDGGPAFFVQERMGIDGQLFRMIKLRTMRLDAEKAGPSFASDYDPRATRLGAVMRKLHIDELPQLVNVLRGEMSLVGPRPERPYYIEKFLDAVPGYMARHRVKSGITGWAQVNGLCGLHGSIDERLKYDLYYIENWSVWFDFKIILMTLFRKPVSATKPQ
ncbi:exopolysaccharide biosynthesis polyprenyl glycosylphosphotransferase [bacterium]|nr:exopolysaccharide biosynthesis polyprenyl glycosylphosphotransferase [bacterium]